MNKPLVLPKFKFDGDSAVTWATGTIGFLPQFGLLDKKWTGVPIRASDAANIPVAWTPELLRFFADSYSAPGTFGSAADFLAAEGIVIPDRWFGIKNTPIASPRLVIYNGPYQDAGLIATLSAEPFLSKLKAKKVMIVFPGGSFFSGGTDNPLSQCTLPPSDYPTISDVNSLGGTYDSTVPNCNPVAWVGGQCLVFQICSLPDNVYVNITIGPGPAVLAADTLVNVRAFDVNRVQSIYPRFDKFGVHFIASEGQGVTDLLGMPFALPQFAVLKSALASFGMTASTSNHIGDASSAFPSTLRPDVYAEVIAKITDFFGL